MPLLNAVASLIDSLNVGPLTVQRMGARVQNQYGGFDASVVSTISISPATVHNVTGRDLLRVPESERNSEVIEIYTQERLFVADGGRSPDIVLYQGRSWRVIQVRDYDLQGGVFVSLAVLTDLQVVP